MPTAAFHALGCKLNQYEIEAIRESFERAGYTTVPFDDPADVYVVNTCAVTRKSAYTSRKVIRRAHRTAPDATIVVAGCYSQVEPETVAAIDGVDLVVGTANKTRVAEYVTRTRERGIRLGGPEDFSFENFDISSFRGRNRAFIKIQEGCRAFCAYCIIPYARNILKSRPLPSVLEQTRALVKAGAREAVITGTHLGYYGDDLPAGAPGLADVIRAVCAVPGLLRVRLSSLEPMDLDDALFFLFTEEHRICRHLHMPFQSGSDTVLARMGRPYDTARLADLSRRLTGACPDLCLGTDIITGFPGETEDEFEETYRFLEQQPLAYMHVFPFSARPGTKAAGMPDQVPPDVLQARAARLGELRSVKIRTFRQRFLDRPVEALIESTRDKATGRLVGITDNYLRILVEGDDKLKNRLVKVIPYALHHEILVGKVAA